MYMRTAHVHGDGHAHETMGTDMDVGVYAGIGTMKREQKLGASSITSLPLHAHFITASFSLRGHSTAIATTKREQTLRPPSLP